MSNTSNKKLKSLTVRLSPEVIDLIKSSSKELQQTQAELITSSVKYYLQYNQQAENEPNTVLQDVLQDVLHEKETRIALLEEQLSKAEAREHSANMKADYLSLPWIIRVFRGAKLLPKAHD